MRRTREDVAGWIAHYERLMSGQIPGTATHEYYRSRIGFLQFELALIPPEGVEIPARSVEQNAQIEHKTLPDNT